MINAKAFANAVTVVTAAFYIICRLLSAVVPELIIGIGNSWMHTVNLEQIRATSEPSMAATIWGLITISAVAWVTTYAAIELYNRWAKK